MAKTNKKAAPVATEEVASVSATQPTTASVEPVQLTISDLQVLARIVDLASRRGAFQAAELSQVGEAFNKLSGFLTYVESVQKSEAEAKEAATSAETTAE